jgi:hypothetical protein
LSPQVSFWLLGSTAGAVLGLAAMWHPSVATNPYLLVLILVAGSALVGAMERSQQRMTSILFLMTLSGMILCQYDCCGGAPGSLWFFGVRLVSVCAGVLFAAAVSNLVLPWYTSAWALDTMASFLTNSMGVLQQMYDRFYADGQAAAAAFGAPAEAADHRGQETATAAMGGTMTKPCPADPVMTSGLLQSPEMAGALVAVQVSLVKDAAAWKRGMLATPPVGKKRVL